jgi:hypothetical protein
MLHFIGFARQLQNEAERKSMISGGSLAEEERARRKGDVRQIPART